MVNIYRFFNNVWSDLKTENVINSSFLFVILLLVTIPLPYGFNNVALVLFVLSVVFKFNKSNIHFSTIILLPVLLFLLMSFSFFWSIDKQATLKAIPKEIALLIIPLAFMLMPKPSQIQKDKIIQYYSYSIVVLVLYYLIRACVRYVLFKDIRMFFYHGENENDYGLVPKTLNAIHVSVFVSIAFFHFFTKTIKTKMEVLISFLLSGFIILLSSKNIILIFIVLILIYLFFFSKSAQKMRLRNIFVFVLLIGIVISFGKIKERFQLEFQTNTSKSINSNVIKDIPNGIHNVSIKEAWTNESFTPNDFFPGTAFRVYQFRMFLELIKKDNTAIIGLGLNASQPKLVELGKKYNVFLGKDNMQGYQTKNFHNQYVQNFAELGIFGFLILILMLVVNFKNAYKSKDFLHIAFAVLMISLFFTESFLWRQRGVMFFTLFYCFFNVGQKKQ
jgi:O-antigen ligase